MQSASEQVIPAGMKPWSGGDSAPDDWDGGEVLFRGGSTGPHVGDWSNTWDWRHGVPETGNGRADIIAYTPKPLPSPAPMVEQAGEVIQTIRDTIVHFLDRDESETDYQGLLRRAEDAAKAIVALSPLGVPAYSQEPSEEQVERAAKGLFGDWVSEDFDNEYCSWEQLPDKVTWRRRARAALTAARARG